MCRSKFVEISRLSFAVTLTTALLSFAQGPYGHAQEAEARRHYLAGQKAQATGAYGTAVEEFQKAARILPKVAEVHASLGLAYNATNDFQNSLRELETAEALKPGLPGVSLYLGIDYVKLNRSGTALKYLEKAIREAGSSTQAWLWLGTAQLDDGKTGEGLESLRHAQTLSPSDPEILFRLGEAYRRAVDTATEQILTAAAGQALVHQIYGDIYRDKQVWTKAAGHYRSALAKDPAWAGAHLGLAEVALRQQKIEEAERELHLELELDPKSAFAESLLAAIALSGNRPEEAVQHLDRAVRMSPQESAFALGLQGGRANEEEYLELAPEKSRECLARLNNLSPSAGRDVAISYLSKRLGSAEDLAAFWKELQNQLPHSADASPYRTALDDFYMGNHTSAEAGLRSWLRSRPADLKGAYLLIIIERMQSMSILHRLLEIAPDSYSARVLMAETYENTEDYERAIAEYRSAEKVAADLPGIHFALGHLFVKTGKLDEASAEFLEELRLNRDHAGANAELGAVLVQRDELTQGIAYLQHAVALFPELWAAHRDLGEAYYRQKKPALAAVELEKALGHDSDGASHYQLGLVYRALGRADDAKRMLELARKIKSDRLLDENSAKALPESTEP